MRMHGSSPVVNNAKAFWNALLILFILGYSLAIPIQSQARLVPMAASDLAFATRVDAGEDKTNATTAACPLVVCAYLPLLSSSLPVRVVEVEFSPTRAYTYRAIGDVTAIYGYPVYNVKVKLQAFDSTGQLLDEYTRQTTFSATLPGQLNPFDLGTNIHYGSPVARVEVVISGFDIDSPTIYAPATVITTTNGQDYSPTVYAQIRNDGPVPMTDVHAVAWKLDQITGFQSEKVADMLLPGETVMYTHTFTYSYSPSLSG
jgi:hypothetical protein